MGVWSSYVLYDSEVDISKFWDSYYCKERESKVLLFLGKGFDPRMNNILKLILNNLHYKKLTCIALDFPAYSQTDGDQLYSANIKELDELQKQYLFELINIEVDTTLEWEKRIKDMSKKIVKLDVYDYSDIILDVSSLPRAIYFNIAKVLYKKNGALKKNLFFMVSENVEIDKLIEKERNEEDVFPLVGFKAMIGIESYLDRRNILIPLIGEKRDRILEKIYSEFKPSDVCPILPFPSKDPRRSDELLLEYNRFLKDRLYIEPQSLTYAHERNPFELYRILDKLIINYRLTLSPISNNVCFGLALLTSKLLSLGALLIGLEHSNCVALYNVSATSYKIKDKLAIVEANKRSEPFLLWITGEAYE